MKKFLIRAIFSVLPAFVIPYHPGAQSLASTPSKPVEQQNASATPAGSFDLMTTGKNSKEFKKEARNIKRFNRISRSFKKQFGAVDNLSWNKGVDGYVASFSRDGIRHAAYYNNGGSLTYLVISYGEDKMPAEIRRMVKSTYFDYSISWVSEIHNDDKVVYLVNIEDANHIKQVVASEEGLKIYKEFDKQSK